MTMLDDRLRTLGDQLDLDDSTLVADVLARLDREPAADLPPAWPRRALRVAAVVLVVAAAVVVAVPSARESVADWFGFDGVTIERDSGLDAPTTADPIDDATADGLGTMAADVDGDVLVSEFSGSIGTDGLTKTLGDGTDVRRVEVDGALGLWIDGDPHEVVYRDPDGQFVVERFAGNILLWQDGDVVRRLEGFDSLEGALAYARALDR